jgi:murein L,D-transpeptidase YcbB/YkuD
MALRGGWLAGIALCGLGSAFAQQPAPADPVATTILTVLHSGQHPDLGQPELTRQQDELERLYGPRGHAPLWLDRQGRPDKPARDAIGLLLAAQTQGLDPEQYDAALLEGRRLALSSGPGRPAPEVLGLFDTALSVGFLRFVSDVHHGQVDPRSLHPGLDLEPKKLDLAAFVLDAVARDRIVQAVAEAEPQLGHYRLLREALAHYRLLARDPALDPPPVVRGKVDPGGRYEGLPQLRRLLAALGDLQDTPAVSSPPPGSPGPAVLQTSTVAPSSTLSPSPTDPPAPSVTPTWTGRPTPTDPPTPTVAPRPGRRRRPTVPPRSRGTQTPAGTPAPDPLLYDGAVVEAVRRFQVRHGLIADGVLGKQTFARLDVPLARRVRQLELGLERLRWLPRFEPGPFLIVNIPAFRLFAFDSTRGQRGPLLRMAVIVGRAMRTQTPVFVQDMRYLVFRPYWNVPYSIAVRELLPKIRENLGYLDAENLEIVPGNTGDEAEAVPSTPESLAAVGTGAMRLRQRPGPQNSLGLVKFVFPNRANVYLHGTPAQRLFQRPRRDFSHGCVRVEDPMGLAEWLLVGKDWTRETIEAAMNGPRTRRVDLARPVPVLMFYTTALVNARGLVLFWDDLYGHDARLEQALAARRPSPP